MQEINSLHEIDLKTEGKTAISSQLTDSFRGSRCLNIENRYFIPAATFDRILTADAVRSVVRECGIDTHRQSEVIQIIEDGGRKTLAILLDLRLPELFTQFVEIDQYSTGVDMKLPYDQRTLESILPFNAARKFHDTQWEFIAPRFRKGMGHRKLEFNTILPFIETKRLGEDAFSEVRAVAIHPDHSNFEEASSRTAQYQSGPRMKSGGERLALEESRVALKACKSTFFTHHSDREIHALSILRPVEHPNIVELLGSYSFHDKTNILFPALDGDLAQLLRQNEPPSQFQTVEDFLFGLCGLASAIETLHYYVHDAHGNSIVVLHRNITPSNILIDRNKLVLAGFGCAEFASDEGDSTERGRADMSSIYRPPEENQELFDDPPSHGFSQGSRSSDIWSFGCLMAEVATYVLADRAEGVLKFQECRIITIANEWKVDMFHSGSSENPGVTSWLAKLRENSSNIGTELVRLITEMLQFEPRMRPNAKKVTHRLRILALSSRTKKVCESYGKVAVGPDANEILAERSKFKHLSSAAGLVDLPLIIMPLFESRSRFTHWADLLLRISDQLTTIQESKPFPSRVSVLRSLNSDLLSLLPLATQERIDSDFRNIVQSEVHDLQMSQKLDESRTTQSSGTSYSQGDSQYEGHSAAASSLTLDENIDRQVSLGSVDPDDGIVSVISDKDDINSQISSRKTPPEVVAEDHLAMLLARNESLIPLYEEAFSKVGRRRFIQNFRRLLKRWYLDLLPYRNDNLKHATVYILKSRRIRTKIAQRIIDVHTPQSDEVRAQTENLNVEIQGKTSFLENWIASNEGFVNAGLDSGSLVSQPPTTISQEPLVVETEQEQYAYVSSDGSDDGDSVEEDAYERKDTEYIRGMERFLTEGKAFQKLVLNLQISLLPVSLHSLITSILSIPNEDIWISSMQDHSTINKMKISIEQITREDWNWWPLRPKMRDLEDDETRVHWVCVSICVFSIQHQY